jgi:hypothetical protein
MDAVRRESRHRANLALLRVVTRAETLGSLRRCKHDLSTLTPSQKALLCQHMHGVGLRHLARFV